MFMKPFKERAANIIEAFLAADVLILLLYRQTVRALEFTTSLPETDTNIGEECHEKSVNELTGQSVLLIPSYYIPLAFFVSASCVSAVLAIWYVYFT